MPIYPDYSCYEKLPKEKRSFFKSEVKHFPAPIDVITLQGTSKLHCRARVNDGLGVLWYGCDALPYPQCEGKDEDADVVEEDDGHEGVHVALHVAGGGELLGDIVFHVDVRMHKTLHDPIEQATEDDAYREAHTDVAQIVNTEVETGEGGGERPEDEGGCHFGTAEEPREKDGNAHGVAGVA